MNEVLHGRVALVTGGGRGIGRAIAEALARSGASVAVTSRTAAQLDETVNAIKKEGGNAVALPGDVASPTDVEQVVTRTQRELGEIDLLVNNAGSAGPAGAVWTQDIDQWRQTLEVNTFGPFLFCRFVLPSMLRRRQGRIINITSGSGFLRGGFAGFSAYNASKAALTRFTETLSVEVRDHGISVFAIGPGPIRTEMLNQVFDPAVQELAPGRAERMWDFDASMDVPVSQSMLLASGVADALSGSVFQMADDILDIVQRSEDVLANDLYRMRVTGSNPNPPTPSPRQ